MATFHSSLLEVLSWNALAFAASFVPHSFFEWFAHRFILHSKVFVRFAYEEHDQNHHRIYLADESFGVQGLDYGTDFRFRDWFLFLGFVVPLWTLAEYLSGKPLVLGATVAACLWLHLFNVVHRHFHAPTGSWLERTWYFRYLREHHRLHHADTGKNLNVAFFPIADLLLGTLWRGGTSRAVETRIAECASIDSRRDS